MLGPLFLFLGVVLAIRKIGIGGAFDVFERTGVGTRLLRRPWTPSLQVIHNKQPNSNLNFRSVHGRELKRESWTLIGACFFTPFHSHGKMSSLIDSVRDIVHTFRPEIQPYEALYKTLHSNPELSHQEKETAALIKHHLTTLCPDLDIRSNIGGHGLIGILKNGPGPIVLLRADMDALPVEEKTGLEYASRKQATDIDGKLQSVGHGQYAINPYIGFPRSHIYFRS